MGEVGEHPDHLAVLGVAALQRFIAADESVLGRLGRAVALQAGLDQLGIGGLGAAEETRDPLIEGGARDAATGREQAEDAPLDPLGERLLGGGKVARFTQPPEIVGDLDEAWVLRSAQLVEDDVKRQANRIRSRTAVAPVDALLPRLVLEAGTGRGSAALITTDLGLGSGRVADDAEEARLALPCPIFALCVDTRRAHEAAQMTEVVKSQQHLAKDAVEARGLAA